MSDDSILLATATDCAINGRHIPKAIVAHALAASGHFDDLLPELPDLAQEKSSTSGDASSVAVSGKGSSEEGADKPDDAGEKSSTVGEKGSDPAAAGTSGASGSQAQREQGSPIASDSQAPTDDTGDSAANAWSGNASTG